MNPATESDRIARLWALACFATVLALTALVLLSWAMGRWQLGMLGEGWLPMAPATALSLFMLAATAMVWQWWPASPATGRVAGAAALAIMGGALVFTARAIITFVPGEPVAVGRMSPVTAIAIAIAGAASALQALGGRSKGPRQAAALLETALVFFGLGMALSYAIDVPPLYDTPITPVAALTSVAITLLSMGLLLRTGADTWPLIVMVASGGPSARSKRLTWGFFALALLLVIAIIVAGFAYLRHERSQANRIAGETVTAVAALKSREIASWYQERVADARSIAATPIDTELARLLADPADPVTLGSFEEWTDVLMNEYGYSGVAIIDASGTVLLGKPSSILPIDGHLLEECQAALRAGEITTHDLRADDGREGIFLHLLVPLGRNGARALMMLELDARRYLFPLIETWPAPSTTAETLLVRREGSEVVFLNELRHRKGTALTLRHEIENGAVPIASKAVQGEEGVVEGLDYRGVPVVAATRSVPGTPWALVAKIDRDEVDAPARREVAVATVVLTALLLAAIAVVRLLWVRRGLASAERELRAAEALQLANERARRMVEANVVGIVIARKQGPVLEANDYYLRMIGFTREEFEAGKVDWREITPPEWLPADEIAIRELVERGRCAPYEKEYLRRDGIRVPVLLVDTLLPGPEQHIVAFALDLTALKQATAERDAFARQRQLALDAAGMGWWTFDPATRNATWDERCRQIFGLEAHEGTIDEALINIHHEDRSRLESTLTQLLDPSLGAPRSTQYRLLMADGSIHWMEVYGVRSEEGPAGVMIVGTAQDITARKAADDAIRYREQLLTDMGRLAKIGGWEFDPATGQGSWTAEVARIHGLDPDRPTHRELGLSFYQGESRLRIERAVRDATELGKGYDLELELTAVDGTKRWVQTIGHATVENGQVVRISGSIQDITERKQAEAALAHQLTELRRWHDATLGRESRILELKDEVNELLVAAGRAPRYRSTESGGDPSS